MFIHMPIHTCIYIDMTHVFVLLFGGYLFLMPMYSATEKYSPCGFAFIWSRLNGCECKYVLWRNMYVHLTDC